MDNTGDEAVAATNDDAASSKLQTINMGYYKDPYLADILPNKLKMKSSNRKAPEICRGYYARSMSIAYIVERFLEANCQGQIISLGAGYDSLYWRLRSHGFLDPAKCKDSKYIEIDMAPVVLHKAMAIKRHQKLAELLLSISCKGESLHGENYHLISFDLRQVNKSSLMDKLVSNCQVNLSKPTLCIAECVLVYMPLQDSNSLIRWLGEVFDDLTLINYEQCNINDRFGEIMLANMTLRHCDMMGVEACKSIESQENRLKSLGLTETKAWTMTYIYNNLIVPSEIERIEKIEFLDEKELLLQLLDHYCIVVGSKRSLEWVDSSDSYWMAQSIR